MTSVKLMADAKFDLSPEYLLLWGHEMPLVTEMPVVTEVTRPFT